MELWTRKACIVCHKPHPGGENVMPWAYIAGSVPAGAITCGPRCTQVAVQRFERTGRTDLPAREDDPMGRMSACRCLTWPCPCACHRPMKKTNDVTHEPKANPS